MDFDQAVQEWLVGAQKIINDHFAKHYPNYPLPIPVLALEEGRRYIRVVRKDRPEDKTGSAHVFIDKTNGDILKPDTWRKPAKHARGNLFDEKKGLGWMGPNGPAYLR